MNFIQTIKEKLNQENHFPILWIALLVFALQGLFLMYRLFPSIQDINLWDEADYINGGRLFAQGTLTNIEWNPLVSLLYALAYLPFQNSPYWLVQSAALGRIIIFLLLWTGSYLLARRLASHFHPLVMVGLLLSTNVFIDIFDNSSDALFAAMSGLALWKFLTYYETRQIGQLGWTSLLIGLAALTRNDGLIIFAVFLLITIALVIKTEHKIKHLLVSILPFTSLLLGYLLLYYLVMGSFLVGTRERTYVAFQQGHLQVYQRDESCVQSITRCAVLEAQQLYGNPRENDYSIFKAIQRNPQAFLDRVKHTLRELPKMTNAAYGKRQAYAFFLLAALGIFSLIRKKNFGLLAILLVWAAYLGVYFLTFFRVGYLQTPYFILFIFAAIGIQTFITSIHNTRFMLAMSAILLLITVIGLSRSLNYLYFNSIVLLMVTFISYLLYHYKMAKYRTTAFLFLSAGLIFQPYNPPQAQTPGQLPEDKAILILQETFEQDSLVASGAPGILHAAKMRYYNLADIDTQIESSKELHDFFINANIEAIYIDRISRQNKHVWQLIEVSIEQYYEILLQDGDIQVLLVKPAP